LKLTKTKKMLVNNFIIGFLLVSIASVKCKVDLGTERDVVTIYLTNQNYIINGQVSTETNKNILNTISSTTTKWWPTTTGFNGQTTQNPWWPTTGGFNGQTTKNPWWPTTTGFNGQWPTKQVQQIYNNGDQNYANALAKIAASLNEKTTQNPWSNKQVQQVNNNGDQNYANALAKIDEFLYER
jgi:hypothetical protein